MEPDIQAIREDVLRSVSQSTFGVRPQVLRKAISAKFGLARGRAQAIVRELVSEGRLAYHERFGTSFIGEALHGPVRVSARVIIAPPGVSCPCGTEDVAVYLASGVAFGSGRHPTTRLALRGMEHALANGSGAGRTNSQSSLLDIGTGSGILVLAGVRLGIQKGIGIDNDQCARFEARQNIRHNGLESRIRVEARLPGTDASFTMVTANLRLPTIGRIFPQIDRLILKGGVAVLSGLKNDELPGLTQVYERHAFARKWEEAEKGWAAVVIQK